jgi:hypothetical protein
MRYLLTPLSAFTWANLNHTLCGCNDPWRDAFDMTKYYYFWADFYLLLASMTTQMLLYGIGKLLCRDTFTIKLHNE